VSSKIVHGDCNIVMSNMEKNSIDTIITDPPYGLNFMGKDWDHGVPGILFWKNALRVAKPGTLLLAFGGTRTFHRLTCAIEDAGWVIRDCIMWVYASGFPKSHNISKAIDRMAGAEREVVGESSTLVSRNRGAQGGNDGWKRPWNQTEEQWGNLQITAPATPAAKLWDGYGTALKPAFEPIIIAMKPLDGTFAQNALEWGVAGLWVDGGRVETNGERPHVEHASSNSESCYGQTSGISGWTKGTTTQGRWPANLILTYPNDAHDADGNLLPNPEKDEVLGCFPVTKSGRLQTHHKRSGGGLGGTSTFEIRDRTGEPCDFGGDEGSVARFFKHCPPDAKRVVYAAKASKSERGKNNNHPTVKPLALMRYLCKITRTPTGGIILDPFMGSGTTGIAAKLEKRDFIGIDIKEEYCEIARNRIALTTTPLF